MSGTVKDFLEQAHKLDRDTFLSRHPYPILIHRKDLESADPRNEYRITLKFKFNTEKREIRVESRPPNPLDAVLVLKKSERNSFSDKVLVGRTETNDVVIPHLTVSKHHAFFRQDPDNQQTILIDTDSTNGTQLNGRQVQPKETCSLSDGDEIRFGDTRFTYYSSGGFYDLLKSLSALR